MRDTEGTIEWYRRNHDNPPFYPNGMCLKICRYARDIGAMYPSAVTAQNATPERYRVRDLSKITRGMVAYFDDPNDGNPYGHIVTVAGWIKGSNKDSLADLMTWTNSVVSGKITLARASFYPNYWGDRFTFAATWLNGQELDLPEKRVKPKPKPKDRLPRIKEAIEEIEKGLAHHRKHDNKRLVKAFTRDLKELKQTYDKFGGK